VLSTRGAACRRRATTSNDLRAALVEGLKAQLHRLRNTALELASFSITLRSVGTMGRRRRGTATESADFGQVGEAMNSTPPPRADQDGERYPRLRSASGGRRRRKRRSCAHRCEEDGGTRKCRCCSPDARERCRISARYQRGTGSSWSAASTATRTRC
jgi:hypothetical protein